MAKRKICIFVGSRANYSSIKSVMRAVDEHPDLELQLVTGASALLERFGKVDDLIRQDGFTPNYTFYNIVEGENPTTMAKSTGLGTIEMSMIFNNLRPDFVIVVGDRFEMMAATLAAAYLNIRVAHTMGGEVSGTIDESIRHAITKFSHVHFPANEDARARIIKMGEDPEYVFNVGCPRMDLIKEAVEGQDSLQVVTDYINDHPGVGAGTKLDFRKPFLLVSQHPVTTEFGHSRFQIEETLKALAELKLQTIMIWPNADAGSDDIAKGIRTFREHDQPDWLHLYKNLPTSIYIHLLKTTSCLVGNSSSGIREGAFLGVPVVNIGSRQNRRMTGGNVITVPYDSGQIKSAIERQVKQGPYPQSDLYGNGEAGKRIAELLVKVNPAVQKVIVY